MPLTRDRRRRSEALHQVRRQVPRLHDHVVRDDFGDAEVVLEPLRRAAPLPARVRSATINSPGTAQNASGNGPALRSEGEGRRPRHDGGVRPPRERRFRRRSRQRARRVDVVRSVVVYRFVVVVAWGQDVGHRFWAARAPVVWLPRRWRMEQTLRGVRWRAQETYALRSSGRRALVLLWRCALVPYRTLVMFAHGPGTPQRATENIARAEKIASVFAVDASGKQSVSKTGP